MSSRPLHRDLAAKFFFQSAVMTDLPETPPPVPPDFPVDSTTQRAGQRIDEGKGRIFPCEKCGADLAFHVGEQQLKCPYCAFVKELDIGADERVEEQDFHAMLERLAELRSAGHAGEMDGEEVRCEACGANVVFAGTLTSSECAYCGSPVQREKGHRAAHRVPVDGVLPFKIERANAQERFGAWVSSRWFAPSAFHQRSVDGKFSGIYVPYWTFDAMTANRYSGERGEHYWVSTGTGKNRTRVRRTRWYSASGFFQRFFDDVLVCASRGLPPKLVRRLDPWPLQFCIPFTQQALAGFLAETYHVSLEDGFVEAKANIDTAIRSEVKHRIGGDEQRVDWIRSRYDAITYKHLLLPIWLLVYRYREKSYRVLINASSGEVQGERPYSWVKILLAALVLFAVAGVVAYLATRSHR